MISPAPLKVLFATRGGGIPLSTAMNAGPSVVHYGVINEIEIVVWVTSWLSQ
jgi:hypothetical protein